MAVLSGNDIRRLIEQDTPLVEGWVDLDEQVQANGFELTLREVGATNARFAAGGGWEPTQQAIADVGAITEVAQAEAEQ